jgi:hypothetical protein
MKNWKNKLQTIGVAVCITAALLMAFGQPIIGANHTGIATVICITGLGIISSANKTSLTSNGGQSK